MVLRETVPPALLELSSLARVDHADTYLVDVDDAHARTAEAWARTMLDDAPRSTRASLVSGWTALGLKLAAGDPGAVLGWRIRQSEPDLLLLGAGGRIGLSGELLFRCEGERLRFATFVQLTGPPARLAWAGIERRHDVVVRGLLERLDRPYPVPA